MGGNPRQLKRGSSPRVRSRLIVHVLMTAYAGIISACAEQTHSPRPDDGLRRDHLRVCGADCFLEDSREPCLGSSPRVRSRLVRVRVAAIGFGIISACAEQTNTSTPIAHSWWDHLRVCGADATAAFTNAVRAGSSPRVRSRQVLSGRMAIAHGIISACAEQTTSRPSRWCRPWDHLRVCGADPGISRCSHTLPGSSPRVRSRLTSSLELLVMVGIISACAEQTHYWRCSPLPCRDHLRVCGADRDELTRNRANVGSSPRVRSRRIMQAGSSFPWGIISACAEQTQFENDDADVV